MEPQFSSLVFVVLGLCALLVESQSPNGVNVFSPPPPPPSPPHPSPPRPESPTPPPPDSSNSPPPPESPNSSSPPESPSRPPPDRPANQLNSKNDSKRPPPPPRRWRRHPRPPPPHPRHKYNAGKKIGLLFVGIAAILQIGVIGFLVFKRRQLLKVKDRYETCS